MKKFLIFASVLLVAAVALMLVCDRLNRYLIFSSSNANAYKMYRLFEGWAEGEIPILGSSRAEAGFAPKEISDRAFNYGLSGSAARETAFHLKAVLSRPGGGLVIVNLDPWGVRNGGFKGDYRFVAGNALVKAEPKVRVPMVDRIPGLRFQGKTRANLAEWVNNRLAVTKTMERGAVLQRISRNEAEWEYIISKRGEYVCSCDEETKAMLADVLSRNERYEVVFVVSPTAAPWQEKFTGERRLAEIEAWLRGFPHVHVIGYAETRDGYGLQDFMDLTHLNESGARRFSRELKERLSSRGLL